MLRDDPSKTPPQLLSKPMLCTIFDKLFPPIVAAVRKVISIGDRNAVLKMIVCVSDAVNVKSDVPSGTAPVFTICQIKTETTQVVIDCILDRSHNNNIVLHPVWYTKHCEEMITKYSSLLLQEIPLLVRQTLL